MPKRGYTERQVPLRSWQVVDGEDAVHDIKAHYGFNNGEEGLIFRKYANEDAERTDVVAAFAAGHWKFFKETTNG